MNHLQLLGDLARKLENIIRLGKIKHVDYAKARCVVDFQGIETTPLLWLNLRAGNDISWDSPTVGEQCIVFSPSGELANGIVLVGLYSQQNPAPSSNPQLKIRQFSDGAIIQYDTQQHQLTATLPDGGTAIITAQGGITLNGNTTINGDLKTNGNSTTTGNQAVQGTSHSKGTITTDGDVIAGGISLKNHPHGGVKAGGDMTGKPQ